MKSVRKFPTIRFRLQRVQDLKLLAFYDYTFLSAATGHPVISQHPQQLLSKCYCVVLLWTLWMGLHWCVVNRGTT